jgi:hypothetical protein
MALDYRIRFYFPPLPNGFMGLVAAHGAAALCGNGFYQYWACRTRGDLSEGEAAFFDRPSRLPCAVVGEFADGLESLLARCCPAGKRLEQEDENDLLRYCLALSQFEVVYRNPVYGLDKMLRPRPPQSAQELLDIANPVWVDDLRALSWAFYDDQHELLTRPATLNPTFFASSLVGGADADLIVDGCLIDIKTTLRPFYGSDALYQLLGYVLLDTRDLHRINAVAVYLSRQRTLVRWELTDLLEQGAGGSAPDLAALRQQVLEAYPERAAFVIKHGEDGE